MIRVIFWFIHFNENFFPLDWENENPQEFKTNKRGEKVKREIFVSCNYQRLESWSDEKKAGLIINKLRRLNKQKTQKLKEEEGRNIVASF